MDGGMADNVDLCDRPGKRNRKFRISFRFHARQRLFDIIAATIAVLGIAPNKLVLKTRERQKGKNQYQKMGEKASSRVRFPASKGSSFHSKIVLDIRYVLIYSSTKMT